MKTLFVVLACMAGITYGFGQMPITNVIYEYSSTSSGSDYSHGTLSYKFGKNSGTANNMQNVVSVAFPDKVFFYNLILGGKVKIRRVNNARVSGNRSLVWMESSEKGNNLLINAPYQDSMELFFSGRSINAGTDNLFGNQNDGSGNNNNIERVDWIVSSGIKSSAAEESGFAVFERGADNQHDPFCIAAILALDSAGNPAKYGVLRRVGTSDFGNVSYSSVNYSVLRKEFNETKLYRSASGNQNRGGVFLTLKDLGVANNEVIYGYSLFGADLPPGTQSADLLDYTNPTFFSPNTSSNTGDAGGIDLIAITGLFNSSATYITLPVSVLDWQASQRTKGIDLKWKINHPSSCSAVIVERSTDGMVWAPIAQLTPEQQQFFDDKTFGGGVMYRLKIVESNHTTQYSPVRSVVTEPKAVGNDFIVKAAGGQLQLSFSAPQRQGASVHISDLNGAVLASRQVFTNEGFNTISLRLPRQPSVVIVTVQAERFFLQKKILVGQM